MCEGFISSDWFYIYYGLSYVGLVVITWLYIKDLKNHKELFEREVKRLETMIMGVHERHMKLLETVELLEKVKEFHSDLRDIQRKKRKKKK